jgi:hypothetical protein
LIAWELLPIGLAALVGGLAVRRIDPGVPPEALEDAPAGPAAGVPAALREAQQVVAGSARAGDLHLRLRPVLREIAAARLADRGLGLDRDPVAARRLLGDELWEILRPGRPRPDEPFAAGLAPRDIARLLSRLEAV